MIAVVDYGVGNLFSLSSSLAAVGSDAASAVIVTGEADVIRAADKIILPGVGAFADAAEKLRTSGLDRVVCEEAKKGKYLLGICLGMQLLFEKSYEFGEHTGLSLISGSVRPIADVIPAELKIPHIGWNALRFHGERRHPLFQYIGNGDFVYFVHSYYLKAADEQIVKASTDYCTHIHASVEKDNVFACQFHPEKSSDVGLHILKNFVEL